VREICRRLDGLPLALELAASRVKVLDPPQLLERLATRLPVLTGGPRDAPERQQTLRATIEWTFTLLDRKLQVLFRQLSVFAGSFSLETAEQVARQPKSTTSRPSSTGACSSRSATAASSCS
jgi:predicted ATPase